MVKEAPPWKSKAVSDAEVELEVVDFEPAGKGTEAGVGGIEANHRVTEIKPDRAPARGVQFHPAAEVDGEIRAAQGNSAFQWRWVNENRNAGRSV